MILFYFVIFYYTKFVISKKKPTVLVSAVKLARFWGLVGPLYRSKIVFPSIITIREKGRLSLQHYRVKWKIQFSSLPQYKVKQNTELTLNIAVALHLISIFSSYSFINSIPRIHFNRKSIILFRSMPVYDSTIIWEIWQSRIKIKQFLFMIKPRHKIIMQHALSSLLRMHLIFLKANANNS